MIGVWWYDFKNMTKSQALVFNNKKKHLVKYKTVKSSNRTLGWTSYNILVWKWKGKLPGEIEEDLEEEYQL